MKAKVGVLWGIVGLALLIAVVAYPQLPETIPTHFNAYGVADQYASSAMVFTFPLMMTLFGLLFQWLPKIDPLKASYKRFAKSYLTIQIIFMLFFLGMELLLIASSRESELVMGNKLILLMTGFLFMGLGNAMPKFKSNFFVGIRTPWTLRSSQTWYETHRFSGKVWFVGGLLCLPAMSLPIQGQTLVLLLVPAGCGILSVVYSYYSYKKGEQPND